MQREFTHKFEDCSKDGGGSLSIDHDVALPARIQMSMDSAAGFTLRANAGGWLHLARVCAEMGLGEYKSGFHIHVDEQFQDSTTPPEFTFVRDDSL